VHSEGGPAEEVGLRSWERRGLAEDPNEPRRRQGSQDTGQGRIRLAKDAGQRGCRAASALEYSEDQERAHTDDREEMLKLPQGLGARVRATGWGEGVSPPPSTHGLGHSAVAVPAEEVCEEAFPDDFVQVENPSRN